MQPRSIMTDFELGNINAAKETFPNAPISHVFSSESGALQENVVFGFTKCIYNDPNDTEVKDYTHLIAALAFFLVGDVTTILPLKASAPESMDEFNKYFKIMYVIGTLAQGYRREVPPRYHPSVQNHYASTMTNYSRNNNASEGWHTRFRLIIGKIHPNIFSAIKELKKKQGDTEI